MKIRQTANKNEVYTWTKSHQIIVWIVFELKKLSFILLSIILKHLCQFLYVVRFSCVFFSSCAEKKELSLSASTIQNLNAIFPAEFFQKNEEKKKDCVANEEKTQQTWSKWFKLSTEIALWASCDKWHMESWGKKLLKFICLNNSFLSVHIIACMRFYICFLFNDSLLLCDSWWLGLSFKWKLHYNRKKRYCARGTHLFTILMKSYPRVWRGEVNSPSFNDAIRFSFCFLSFFI